VKRFLWSGRPIVFTLELRSFHAKIGVFFDYDYCWHFIVIDLINSYKLEKINPVLIF